MPTYDYECQNCGYQYEVLQRITEDPLITCPKCEKHSLKRLIGAGAGIIFKGSGFYTTDYKSGGGGGTGAGTGGKSSSSESSAGESSSSKSDGDGKSKATT
jgi:putative FmdB family regulatory protein